MTKRKGKPPAINKEKDIDKDVEKNPPGPVDVQPVVGFLFGLCFVIFGLNLFFQNFVSPDKQIPAELAAWKSTTGKVVRSISHYRRGGDWYAVTFQYQVDDRSYQFDDKSDAKIEKTELKYDATSPSHFYRERTIEERNYHMLSAFFCFLVGSYQIYYSVIHWHKSFWVYNKISTVVYVFVLITFIYSCLSGHIYPGQESPVDLKQPYGIARIL